MRHNKHSILEEYFQEAKR
jgi:hypothetical protein